jgi:hypothetical protein
MKCKKTRSLGALYACTLTYLANGAFLQMWMNKLHEEVKKSAHELPALFRYLIGTGDRFHENIIHYPGFGHPDCAKEMDPFSHHGLLKCTTLVRT